MDLVQFVILFIVWNTEVFGVTDKPYIVKWCMINSFIILFQTLHLAILKRRHQAFCSRILVGAIYSAQANNEGLKSLPAETNSPYKQQPEMKFDT